MSTDEQNEAARRDEWSVVVRLQGTKPTIARERMLELSRQTTRRLAPRLTEITLTPRSATIGLRIRGTSADRSIREAIGIVRSAASATGIPDWRLDSADATRKNGGARRRTIAPGRPPLFGRDGAPDDPIEPPMTCDPAGPPYTPICSEGFYYYPLGNQIHAVPDVTSMITQSPSRHVANMSNGCSATLISSDLEWYLTAAHCVTPPPDPLSIVHGQFGPSCRPYGTVPVLEVHVPREWKQNVGGSYNSLETRAYDWALLKVPRMSQAPAIDAAPPLQNMPFGGAPGAAEGTTVFTMGYGCGRDASGTLRGKDRPYTTQLGDEHGEVLDLALFPPPPGEVLVGGGGVYRSTLEATGGFSGGPVWTHGQDGDRLIGVMVGSPQSVCEGGEIWASAMTPTTLSRIIAVVGDGFPANMVKYELEALTSSPPQCD